MVNHEHLSLPPQRESVRAGRHFVQLMLAEWDVEQDLVDVATLLVSEALTNAVIHAGTTLRLEVFTDGELVIEVTDHDTTAVLPPVAAAGLVSLMDEPDLEAEGGRGLMMIATLATQWGISYTASGKTVWFTFDMAEPADAEPADAVTAG